MYQLYLIWPTRGRKQKLERLNKLVKNTYQKNKRRYITDRILKIGNIKVVIW